MSNRPEIELCGFDRIDEVRPLWSELRLHHGDVAPQLGPVRDEPESWELRRAIYAERFTRPGTFLEIARIDGKPVGYALVCLHDDGPDDTWHFHERVAEVETLSVAAAVRGRGIGNALLDAADAQLERIGAGDVVIAVAATNDGARRFYEGRGLMPYVVYYRRPPNA